MMNAIVGTPSPWAIIRNIPRMARGQEMVGRDVLDRPCREMKIATVAVYSDADARASHVAAADFAVRIAGTNLPFEALVNGRHAHENGGPLSRPVPRLQPALALLDDLPLGERGPLARCGQASLSDLDVADTQLAAAARAHGRGAAL